ncbi:MAG TPA: NUDIX domain-containing protein [Chitinophagaceae bacterium]|nr:NUDIX domain-containing protein [Chitinophagaceae bacterium]
MALFNIRVYGILKDENNNVLLSDEYIYGNYFTKFPGGGLEFGEGTRECLIREFKEETGLDITVGKHIYTTDFFQISAFNNKDQIISIYYYVHASNLSALKTSATPFNFKDEQLIDKKGEVESFRFIELNKLTTNDVTLPIDKVVVEIIKQAI